MKQTTLDCQTCGEPDGVYLTGRDTECDNCHQPYNGFGQRLRHDWERNPSNRDYDIDDLTGFEMSD